VHTDGLKHADYPPVSIKKTLTYCMKKPYWIMPDAVTYKNRLVGCNIHWDC